MVRRRNWHELWNCILILFLVLLIDFLTQKNNSASSCLPIIQPIPDSSPNHHNLHSFSDRFRAHLIVIMYSKCLCCTLCTLYSAYIVYVKKQTNKQPSDWVAPTDITVFPSQPLMGPEIWWVTSTAFGGEANIRMRFLKSPENFSPTFILLFTPKSLFRDLNIPDFPPIQKQFESGVKWEHRCEQTRTDGSRYYIYITFTAESDSRNSGSLRFPLLYATDGIFVSGAILKCHCFLIQTKVHTLQHICRKLDIPYSKVRSALGTHGHNMRYWNTFDQNSEILQAE